MFSVWNIFSVIPWQIAWFTAYLKTEMSEMVRNVKGWLLYLIWNIMAAFMTITNNGSIFKHLHVLWPTCFSLIFVCCPWGWTFLSPCNPKFARQLTRKHLPPLRQENAKCDCSTVTDPCPANGRLHSPSADYYNYEHTTDSTF